MSEKMDNVINIKPSKPLEDWQQRVIDERIALQDKTEKLAFYLAGNKSTLPKHQVVLLTAQINAMCVYHDVLQSRINLFNTVISDIDSEEFDYPITGVDEFGHMVSAWHNHVMHDLNHLLNVPDGTTVSIGTSADENTPVAQVILTGDILHAFKAAVMSSMSIVDKLPFIETKIEIDTSNNSVSTISPTVQ